MVQDADPAGCSRREFLMLCAAMAAGAASGDLDWLGAAPPASQTQDPGGIKVDVLPLLL